MVVSASHGARSISCCAIRLFSQRSTPMKSKESSWDGLQPAAGRLAELAQGGKVLAHVLHRWGHFPRGCNLVKGRSRKPGVKRVKIPDCGGWKRQEPRSTLPTMLCTNCRRDSKKNETHAQKQMPSRAFNGERSEIWHHTRQLRYPGYLTPRCTIHNLEVELCTTWVTYPARLLKMNLRLLSKIQVSAMTRFPRT